MQANLKTTLPFAALAVLTVMVCMTQYADYDLWWHLALGETIFDTRALPWVDTFSYTVAGRHQFTGEWLADLSIFLVFDHAGFVGLNLLKAGMLLLTFWLLFLSMQTLAGDSRRVVVAAVITLVTVLFAVRFRLFVRPYLFSLPFLAAFLYLISRWRAGVMDRRIYLLPVLMLVWVNMSVGAVFGLFLVGVAAGLDLLQEKRGSLLPVLALCVAASLLNPETWRLYTLALDLTSDPYRTLVGEYQPITRDILFGSGLRYTLGFQLLAAGGVTYFILCRGWKNLFALFVFVFLLYESFRQVRLIELFSVAVAPFVFVVLHTLLNRLPGTGRLHGPAGQVLLSAALLALVPLTVFNSPVYAYGAGPKPGLFPESALRFLQDNEIDGRLFNSYGFGGYLAWRDRDRKVFIDGRYRRVYTPAEYGEYKAAMESPEGWAAAERQHGIDYAVLEYDLLSQRFPSHLPDNAAWALVYWDNHSLVYVKRNEARAELIGRYEYRVARPTFLDLSYLDPYGGPMLNTALAGLEREVALNPDNQWVRLARIFLLYRLGPRYFPAIQSELEAILDMKPDFAMKHSALAIILAAGGDTERAKAEVIRALELDPFDEGALAMADDLGMEMDVPERAVTGHH